MTYSVTGGNFPIHFMTFFALLFLVISNSKDFEDMQGEKKFGINSVPIILGSNSAYWVIVLAEFFLLLLMGYLSITTIIAFKYIYATGISLMLFFPMAWLLWKDVKRIQYKDRAFDKTHDNGIRDIITQSDGVTFSVLFVVFVQLIYGLIATAL